MRHVRTVAQTFEEACAKQRQRDAAALQRVAEEIKAQRERAIELRERHDETGYDPWGAC